MKTIVETSSEKIHAVINSNVFVKWNGTNPVLIEKAAGLAETENVISSIEVFEKDGFSNVKVMSLSLETLRAIVGKCDEIISELTDPDYPDF